MIVVSRMLTPNTLVVAGLAVAILGCGMGTSGTAIEGTVTLDGNPLESGKIVFEPQGSGKMAVGSITQGTYEIPAENAPTDGQYLVRITAERPTGKKAAAQSRSLEDQGAADQQYEQYLPPRYNTRSELTADISNDSHRNFDFALTLE